MIKCLLCEVQLGVMCGVLCRAKHNYMNCVVCKCCCEIMINYGICEVCCVVDHCCD